MNNQNKDTALPVPRIVLQRLRLSYGITEDMTVEEYTQRTTRWISLPYIIVKETPKQVAYYGLDAKVDEKGNVVDTRMLARLNRCDKQSNYFETKQVFDTPEAVMEEMIAHYEKEVHKAHELLRRAELNFQRACALAEYQPLREKLKAQALVAQQIADNLPPSK
jgi:hypothetical protein